MNEDCYCVYFTEDLSTIMEYEENPLPDPKIINMNNLKKNNTTILYNGDNNNNENKDPNIISGQKVDLLIKEKFSNKNSNRQQKLKTKSLYNSINNWVNVKFKKSKSLSNENYDLFDIYCDTNDKEISTINSSSYSNLCKNPLSLRNCKDCEKKPKTTNLNIIIPETTLINENYDQTSPISSPNQKSNSTVELHELSMPKNIYSTYNSFVLQYDHSSLVVNSNLQHTSVDSQYTIDKEIIFEWIQGAYCSGYMTKYSSKTTSSINRMSKRFFILKNDKLMYFKAEKGNNLNNIDKIVEDSNNTSVLQLTAETSISIESKSFSRFIKIQTSEKALYLKLKEKSDEKEKIWIEQLNKAINQLSKSQLLKSKDRVETIWIHDNKNTSLASTDAYVENDMYIKVGLLQTPFFDILHKGGSNIEKPLYYSYVLNLGSNENEQINMNILLLNESPAISNQIQCIKIYGEMILLGGYKGLIAIGVVGVSTNIKNDWRLSNRKVIYCIPNNCANYQSDSSDVESFHNNKTVLYPHTEDSNIISISTCHRVNYYAAIDNHGYISFWHLDRSNAPIQSWSDCLSTTCKLKNLGKCYKVKPQIISVFSLLDNNIIELQNETIAKINFTSDDMYLIVSTTKRIVLLSFGMDHNNVIYQMKHEKVNMFSPLRSPKSKKRNNLSLYIDTNDNNNNLVFFHVKGWNEIHKCEENSYGYFSLYYNNNEKRDKNIMAVLWKLETDETYNVTNFCKISRIKITKQMFHRSIKTLRLV